MADLTRAGFTPGAAHRHALALAQDGIAEVGPYTLAPTREPTPTGNDNPTGDTAA